MGRSAWICSMSADRKVSASPQTERAKLTDQRARRRTRSMSRPALECPLHPSLQEASRILEMLGGGCSCLVSFLRVHDFLNLCMQPADLAQGETLGLCTRAWQLMQKE